MRVYKVLRMLIKLVVLIMVTHASVDERFIDYSNGMLA